MRNSTPRLLQVLLPLAGLVWLTAISSAESVRARVATMPAPRRIEVAVEAMSVPPPNAEAYGDRKQDALGEHHRKTIDLVPPAGIQAFGQRTDRSVKTNVVGGLIQADTELQLFRNHQLTQAETNGVTSTVCEPSVAVRGQEVLVTGNWFAAFSKDAGNQFTYLNPATTFPSTAGGFCCDQVAIYDKPHDLMIWFLQYITTGQGNVARVAVARGDDIANQNWRYYDFSPQGVGQWAGEWFDYPELALGHKYLYVTTNTFSAAANNFTRAVILRIPLAKLAAYQEFNYDFFDTNQVASIRPAQGASDTMYFGAHRNLNTIRVFEWPENSSSLDRADVVVQAWKDRTYVASGPDGNDFVGRTDGRITASALVGNQLALGWTAAQDSNHPFPHVRVALIDRESKEVTAEPHLWHDKFAFAYPAFAPNSDGQLGLSTHYGGGLQLHPSHAVGVLETSPTQAWNLLSTASGTNAPSANKWGDYLAIRRHARHPKSWVATGFTLQNGAERQNIRVNYIHFGLEGSLEPVEEDGDEQLRKYREKLQALRQKLQELRADVQKVLERIDALSEIADDD